MTSVKTTIAAPFCLSRRITSRLVIACCCLVRFNFCKKPETLDAAIVRLAGIEKALSNAPRS